MQIEILLIMNC